MASSKVRGLTKSPGATGSSADRLECRLMFTAVALKILTVSSVSMRRPSKRTRGANTSSPSQSLPKMARSTSASSRKARRRLG